MATSNYKGTRVPLIALDYNSRFLAEKKEILFDYKTGKLYVVSAEDKSVIFDITKLIMKEVEKGIDLTNYVFNIEGVGTVNLSNYIKQLSTHNLQTLDETNKRYRVPQASFDNDSIVDYDGRIEINGFHHALNNTYPVKDGNIVKWVPRTDTDIVSRVKRLEDTAPPNAAEFKKLREDVAAVKFTANEYSNLPVLRRDIDSVTTRTGDLETSLAGITPKVSTLESSIAPINTRIRELENKVLGLDAREDYGTRVTALENKLNGIQGKEDLTTKVNLLLQKVANLEQGEDFGSRINAIQQRLTIVSDNSENRLNTVNQEIAALKEYDTNNTQVRNSLNDRISALENIGIANALDALKVRTGALEGVPNLTTNVTNLEATTNTLTNGFAQLNSKVQGLLTAEDPLPRIQVLENKLNTSSNLPQEALINLAGGTTAVISAGRVYNYILDTAEPRFQITRGTGSTQEIILILDPHNLNGQAFNIHITRHDGVELKLPRRIIPSKNNETQLVRLNTYDGGVNWFCTVSPTFVGRDAEIDNTI